MAEDKEWTSDKGAQHNNLASNTIPLLERALPPASADTGAMAGGMGAMGGSISSAMMAGRGERMGAMMGGKMGGPMMGGMMGGGMMGAMMGGEMGRMMREGMGRGMMMGSDRLSEAEAKKRLKTLTRTDFLLQFVWKPLKPENQPKTDEERDTKLKEIVKLLEDEQKNNPAVTIPKGEDIEAASLKKSKELDSKIEKALTPGTPGAAAPGGAPGFGGPPAGAPPGAPPGPAATKGASPPPQQ
jgi:type IV pilus assembly protein PilM